MGKTFYIKDYLDGTKNDSEAIEACFAEAARASGATVIFDGGTI